MIVEKLTWDSQFFKKEIGKIVVDYVDMVFYQEINHFIVNSPFDLIYIFEKNVEYEHNPIVNKTLKDTKVLYQKTAHSSRIDVTSCKRYSDSVIKNINDLYSLAIASGAYSRYRIDPKFSKKNFEDLYTKWVDNSLNKTIADDVFIYEEHGNIIGFITVKYIEEKTEIGLIAVKDSYRGKKIGSSLLNTVECETIKRGKSYISVATQLSNLSACRFYEKNEYEIENKVNIYHIWK